MRVRVITLTACLVLFATIAAPYTVAKDASSAPQKAPSTSRWQKIKTFVSDHREAILSSVVTTCVVWFFLQRWYAAQLEAERMKAKHALTLRDAASDSLKTATGRNQDLAVRNEDLAVRNEDLAVRNEDLKSKYNNLLGRHTDLALRHQHIAEDKFILQQENRDLVFAKEQTMQAFEAVKSAMANQTDLLRERDAHLAQLCERFNHLAMQVPHESLNFSSDSHLDALLDSPAVNASPPRRPAAGAGASHTPWKERAWRKAGFPAHPSRPRAASYESPLKVPTEKLINGPLGPHSPGETPAPLSPPPGARSAPVTPGGSPRAPFPQPNFGSESPILGVGDQ